jgi:hypothetical protein
MQCQDSEPREGHGDACLAEEREQYSPHGIVRCMDSKIKILSFQNLNIDDLLSRQPYNFWVLWNSEHPQEYKSVQIPWLEHAMKIPSFHPIFCIEKRFLICKMVIATTFSHFFS